MADDNLVTDLFDELIEAIHLLGHKDYKEAVKVVSRAGALAQTLDNKLRGEEPPKHDKV